MNIEVIIVTAIITFFFKLLDNSFSTLKTIFLNKEKYFFSALFNSIGTFFYLVAVVNIAKSNNIVITISACIATFIGTYLPAKFIKKIEKDNIYIFEITSNDFQTGIDFADMIRNKNLPIKTTIVYDKGMNKVLNCKIYSQNRKESKIIKELIPEDFKYTILIPLEE